MLLSPIHQNNEKAFPLGKATFLRKSLFTGLVANRAGSLASGLAGSLALAATARLQALLQIRLVDRLDMLHADTLLPAQITKLCVYTV